MTKVRLSKQIIINSYKKTYDRAKGLRKSINESKSCTQITLMPFNYESASNRSRQFTLRP